MRLPHNLFIFEGSDGSGKSEALRRVTEALRKTGTYDVYTFQEPSLEARAQLQNPRLTPEEQLQIFKEDRAKLYATSINPLLTKPNTIILVDRGWPSTTAYQIAPIYAKTEQTSIDAMLDPKGETHRSFLDKVGAFNAETMHGTCPIVLFFSCDEDTAVQRASASRTNAISHLDQEGPVRRHWNIYRKMHELFTNIPAYTAHREPSHCCFWKHVDETYVFNPSRWIFIDTKQSIPNVVDTTLAHIYEQLQLTLA